MALMSPNVLFVVQYLECVLVAAMLWVWWTEHKNGARAQPSSPLTPRPIPLALMLHMVPNESTAEPSYDVILRDDKRLPTEDDELGMPQRSVPMVDLTQMFAEFTNTMVTHDPWTTPNYFAVFHRRNTDDLTRQILQHDAKLVQPEKIFSVPGVDRDAVIGALLYCCLVSSELLEPPLFAIEETGTNSATSGSRPPTPSPTPGTPES